MIVYTSIFKKILFIYKFSLKYKPDIDKIKVNTFFNFHLKSLAIFILDSLVYMLLDFLGML